MATIRFDAQDLLNNLASMETKAEIAVKMYAQEGAKVFENYAKNNRRWQDQTGHARQRLVGWVERNKKNVRIYIGHGVDYGLYLELAHEKKYAILKETVEKKGQEVLKGFQNMINRMKV
jgi:hypothetical protein